MTLTEIKKKKQSKLLSYKIPVNVLFMLFAAEHFAHCEVRPNSLLSDSVHQIHGSIKMSQKVRYIHGSGAYNTLAI